MFAKYLFREQIIHFILYGVDLFAFVVNSHMFLLLQKIMPICTQSVAKLLQLQSSFLTKTNYNSILVYYPKLNQPYV